MTDRIIAHTAELDTIIGTMQRCHNCGEAHRTWQCSEIAQAMRIPPDPRKAVRDYEGYLARAQQQLAAATTPDAKRDAQQWVDNAQRGLDKWRAVAEMVVGR